jgi:predicted DNA-binding protein YlxM (UPF0122 family)
MNFKEYVTEQYWNLSKDEILRYFNTTKEDMYNLLRAKRNGASLSNYEEKMLKAYFPELRKGETFTGQDGRRWRRTATGVEPA